jgi:hypothetical protein
MTTYILSQHPNYWYVAQYEGAKGGPIIKTASENEALSAAMKNAKEHIPSKVVRIAMNGESTVLAKFDV